MMKALDARRRFHWHEYFLALRRRDPDLATYHRRLAQKLEAPRQNNNFRRSARPLEPSLLRRTRRHALPQAWQTPAKRRTRGNPAVALIEASAGASSSLHRRPQSPKATLLPPPSVESVAANSLDRDDRAKRKLRRVDSSPGRPGSERRSGTATLGAPGVRNGGRTARCCRRCGCTQYNACEDDRLMDSCSWVERDLCSACLTGPEFKRFLAGNRKPSLGR